MKVKSRYHPRSDEINALCDSVKSSPGIALVGNAFEAVEFADTDYEVVLANGGPAVMYVSDQSFLTAKDANQFPPTTNIVTINAGAISFVSSGTDMMRPDITEIDKSIEADDLVVVAEETHDRVLVVSCTLENGADLVGGPSKVVESIHRVGDNLSELSV